MTIKSSAFGHGGVIPAKYTCDGNPPSRNATEGQRDINPPLEIAGVPPGAKSLVMIVDDPDAPAGTWIHWTVWNMDPETTQIPEGVVIKEVAASQNEASLAQHAVGREGVTSFGKPGYGSPCPPASPSASRGGPSGSHRYFFKLYALDKMLNLEPQTTAIQLAGEMDRHILATAELMGTYQRVK